VVVIEHTGGRTSTCLRGLAFDDRRYMQLSFQKAEAKPSCSRPSVKPFASRLLTESYRECGTSTKYLPHISCRYADSHVGQRTSLRTRIDSTAHNAGFASRGMARSLH